MAKATVYDRMQATLTAAGDELYHLTRRYRARLADVGSTGPEGVAGEAAEIDAHLEHWKRVTEEARAPQAPEALEAADVVRVTVFRSKVEPSAELLAAEMTERLAADQDRVIARSR